MSSKTAFIERLAFCAAYWSKAAAEQNLTTEEALDGMGFCICTGCDGSGDSFSVSHFGTLQTVQHEDWHTKRREVKV